MLEPNQFDQTRVMDDQNSLSLNLQALDSEPSDVEIHSGVVDEKIRVLRSQLKDTYNRIITARDMLTTVSFEKIKEESTKSTQETFKDDVDEIVGAKTVSDGLAVLKNKINQSQTGFSSATFPEVKSFFGALSALNKSMEEIEGHKDRLIELNGDIHQAILDFEKSITENQLKFEDLEANNKAI